jgi:hypothetical protein
MHARMHAHVLATCLQSVGIPAMACERLRNHDRKIRGAHASTAMAGAAAREVADYFYEVRVLQ